MEYNEVFSMQATQKCPLCLEFTVKGVSARKDCNFCNECPLYVGSHAFSACPKRKVKPCYSRGGKKQRGGPDGSSLADKGSQFN